MAVVWNKVTWYSKAIALALFVILPFVGFWLGTEYGKTLGLLIISPGPGVRESSGMVSVGTMNNYYSDTSAWQTDTRSDAGFSFAYPLDFSVDDNYAAASVTDWRLDANGAPGQKFVTLTIPSAFEPQTNFADAMLTIGKSANADAVADCLTPDQSGGPGASVSTSTINGITFSVFKFTGAGAGNFYETTSYRTVRSGACWAIEYTVHSGQIANYPTSYDLQPFNDVMVTGVLDRIVGTFQFQ